MSIEKLLSIRRNQQKAKSNAGKDRANLYKSIQQGRKSADSGEQAVQRDESVDGGGTGKKRKPRKKKGKVPGHSAESHRVDAKPSIQHSVQRSDDGGSTLNPELSTGSSGITGDLLSGVPVFAKASAKA